MASDITPEARRLYAVVVNELWHKHPELVVPGWKDATVHHCGYDGFAEKCWHKAAGKYGYTQVVRSASEDQILAAAAKCADYLERNDGVLHGWSWGSESWYVDHEEWTKHAVCWCSTRFAAILAEKGIEHE